MSLQTILLASASVMSFEEATHWTQEKTFIQTGEGESKEAPMIATVGQSGPISVTYCAEETEFRIITNKGEDFTARVSEVITLVKAAGAVVSLQDLKKLMVR